LEWGGNQSAFLYIIQYNLIFKNNEVATTFLHPAIFIPMLGQLLFILALFFKKYFHKLTITGIVLVGLLVLLVLGAGVLSKNIKIVISTLPFLLLATVYFFKKRDFIL
jgi:hypothetical protein